MSEPLVAATATGAIPLVVGRSDEQSLLLRKEVQRLTEKIFGVIDAVQECSDPELADDRYVEFSVEAEDVEDAARKYDQWQRALLTLAVAHRSRFHVSVNVRQ